MRSSCIVNGFMNAQRGPNFRIGLYNRPLLSLGRWIRIFGQFVLFLLKRSWKSAFDLHPSLNCWDNAFVTCPNHSFDHEVLREFLILDLRNPNIFLKFVNDRLEKVGGDRLWGLKKSSFSGYHNWKSYVCSKIRHGCLLLTNDKIGLDQYI